MSQVSPNYSEMQSLASVEGLQESTQQQMSGIQPRINNQVLRVIPGKMTTNPFNSQHSGQSLSLLPTTKVAIVGSQNQQLPMSAHSNNNPYIVTLTNNSAGNNSMNATESHFQQMKSNSQLDGYHYMDETTGQIIYQPNDSMQQNSVYIPQQTIFYTNANGQVIAQDNFLPQHQESVHQQLTTNPMGNKTFIIQQERVHEESQFMAGGPRASPATVRWLLENIEEAEGVSLPRSTLYDHFLKHCDQLKLEPMNQASFGKLIRSVFSQIRTRRLGTRGNSKYHYYGIQIKSTSKLNSCDYKISENENYDDSSKRMIKGMTHLTSIGSSNNQSSLSISGHPAHHHHQLDGVVIEGAQTSRTINLGLNSPQEYFKNATITMPVFGRLELEADEQLPDGVGQKHLEAYEELYAENCEAIITSVMGLQFNLIESLWKSFWRTDNQSYKELEATLPQKTLYALSEMTSVQKYTAKSDYVFYQQLVEILIADVLKPIPSTLTQMIRNFAKNLEGSLRRSMAGVCDKMLDSKISAAKAFAQILRRYTSLNHLAQAARAVLQNPTQVAQMLTDLNRVDFNNIQEQGYWVCGCSADLVKELECDLKRTLEKQSSLEEWAAWLEGVVNHVLKPVERHANFVKIALKFLLNWSFYCLMVIRDLTLRSAASFGSFHLIHLLFDEYMFYLIERRVAEVRGETPIAVVSCRKDIDERFEDLHSRSQLETFVSTSSNDNACIDDVVGCPSVPASVKQEYSSTTLTNSSTNDDSKESKREMDVYDLYFNSDNPRSHAHATPIATDPLVPTNEDKRNLKITNVLNTSNGKMVVLIPSLDPRNPHKRFKPNSFKP